MRFSRALLKTLLLKLPLVVSIFLVHMGSTCDIWNVIVKLILLVIFFISNCSLSFYMSVAEPLYWFI